MVRPPPGGAGVNEQRFYQIVLAASLAAALGVFALLFYMPAPYGRHARRGWGVHIPNRLAWLMMEAVSPAGMLVFFLTGSASGPVPLVFLLLWQAHYIHRAFIYPFERRDAASTMPLMVAVMGMIFNLGNAYGNGRYLFHFAAGRYPAAWLRDPRFLLGFLLFTAGFVINRWADARLRALRQPGESSYKIPQGGLFRFISCPNYLGEILEWSGWALATWSLPGLVFALWTFANLAPRASAHHRWYRATFLDYPPRRRALIPFLW